MKKIVRRKAKGEKIAVAPIKKVREAKVYDIMSALKASLGEKKSRKRA